MFPFVPDLQQQIHDHHPDAADRMCPPQNAHLSDRTKTFKDTIATTTYRLAWKDWTCSCVLQITFSFFSFLLMTFFWTLFQSMKWKVIFFPQDSLPNTGRLVAVTIMTIEENVPEFLTDQVVCFVCCADKHAYVPPPLVNTLLYKLYYCPAVCIFFPINSFK